MVTPDCVGRVWHHSAWCLEDWPLADRPPMSIHTYAIWPIKSRHNITSCVMTSLNPELMVSGQTQVLPYHWWVDESGLLCCVSWIWGTQARMIGKRFGPWKSLLCPEFAKFRFWKSLLYSVNLYSRSFVSWLDRYNSRIVTRVGVTLYTDYCT